MFNGTMRGKILLTFALTLGCGKTTTPTMTPRPLTTATHGHILTNTGVWSPDSQWIVYDTRPDTAGSTFTGTTIERVNVTTGEVQKLYESKNGAHCGVATVCPTTGRVIFILGPENPTAEYAYGISRRQGVIVNPAQPGRVTNMDARNLNAPFTPGSLRGGSHVHTFNADGWVSFTYDDDLVKNGRNVCIGIPNHAIKVNRNHVRNHDGEFFCVVVTKTTQTPKPGSDEISKAFEETWIGEKGYRKADGNWQKHAIACQGLVTNPDGSTHVEIFVVDIPEDPTKPGALPLEGSRTLYPAPPLGITQRRLTHTKKGIAQTPRHWLRTSPDGTLIAFLMADEKGIVQLHVVPTVGGVIKQVTTHTISITTAINWTPDGTHVVYGMANEVYATNIANGVTVTVTKDTKHPLRSEAVVPSPDGKRVAFVRTVGEGNQVFVAEMPQ